MFVKNNAYDNSIFCQKFVMMDKSRKWLIKTFGIYRLYFVCVIVQTLFSDAKRGEN